MTSMVNCPKVSEKKSLLEKKKNKKNKKKHVDLALKCMKVIN